MKSEPQLICINTATRLSGYSSERLLYFLAIFKIKGIRIKADTVTKVFFYRDSIIKLKREPSNKIS